MKKFALTGNIGSGKSWVSGLFEKRLNIPVFYSDIEAKRLYLRADIRVAMKERFGRDVYFRNGRLDRKRLSELVFNDVQAMRDIEKLLYPALNAYFLQWAENQNAPYVLYESAIILEKHLESLFDGVIMVTASEETRLRRVMLRDHCDEAAVRQRMAKQWAENEKLAHANYIIFHDSDDDDEALLEQVLRVHEKLSQN
jgi:dephospho-CoA kinase